MKGSSGRAADPREPEAAPADAEAHAASALGQRAAAEEQQLPDLPVGEASRAAFAILQYDARSAPWSACPLRAPLLHQALLFRQAQDHTTTWAGVTLLHPPPPPAPPPTGAPGADVAERPHAGGLRRPLPTSLQLFWQILEHATPFSCRHPHHKQEQAAAASAHSRRPRATLIVATSRPRRTRSCGPPGCWGRS